MTLYKLNSGNAVKIIKATMKRATCILSLLLSFSVIAIIISVVCLIVDFNAPEEDRTPLGKYFREKKDKLIKSLESTQFVNMSSYIKDKGNPVAEINQALIESGYVYIPKNMHGIFSAQVTIPDNAIIQFEEGTTLFARRPSNLNATENCLFNFNGVNNATFIGNGMKVYMSKDKDDPDDFPILCVRGSSNIFIMDFGVIGSYGEGMVISGNKDKSYSENIEIKNVNIDACKTGLRIESVNTLKAYRINVKHSSEKDGGAAIKITGKKETDILEGIDIEYLVTERNRNSGLEIAPNVDQLVLHIRGYESRQDSGKAPIYMKHSPNYGKVILEDLSVTNEAAISMIFEEWDTRNCPIEVIDPKLNWKPGFLYGIDREDTSYTNLEKLDIKH